VVPKHGTIFCAIPSIGKWLHDGKQLHLRERQQQVVYYTIHVEDIINVPTSGQ
jgi:hypothetical protein